MSSTKTLQQHAYDYIKDLIMTNQLEYSEIYSETKTAKEIGVSRTPMRDALHRLSQDRYIDIIPSKGFCIHQMTEQDIIETFQIRSAIEGYCTLQIARDFESPKSKQLFKKLDSLMAQLENIHETSGNIEKFADIDNQFHRDIVAFSKNKSFSHLFNTYLFQIRRLAILSLQHEGRMEDTIKEHREILNAMKTGNVTDIYQITMNHMEIPKGINLSDVAKNKRFGF